MPLPPCQIDPQEVQRVVLSNTPPHHLHGGLDHNWVMEPGDSMQLGAELLCPRTQLLLQVSSTLPGLQCYTGNGLSDDGIHGCHEGDCLEKRPGQKKYHSPMNSGVEQ